MPNVLAHLGIQGLATRALVRDADHKWIYLGCIIPDLPWILQRIIRLIFPGIDPYDLRLYVVALASLCFCILLSLALSTLSTHFKKISLVLILNTFFHLLLDACQTKWANGVHFLAPFNWELANFHLFWPESIITYLLTIFGVVYFLVAWRHAIKHSPHITWRPLSKITVFAGLLTVYFVGPFLLLAGVEKADNHFVSTLRNRNEREGRYIELDRNSFTYSPSGGILQTFAGEELYVARLPLVRSATVSIRGKFLSARRIGVEEYHVHLAWIRDTANYVGLTLVGTLWLYVFWRRKYSGANLATKSS